MRLTRGKKAAQDMSVPDFVQTICALIPERGRLAEQMAVDPTLDPITYRGACRTSELFVVNILQCSTCHGRDLLMVLVL